MRKCANQEIGETMTLFFSITTILLVPALLRACWSSSTSVRVLMGIGGVLAIFLAINGPALIFSDPGPDLLFILGATAGTLILAGFALRRCEAR
jgi:hypothetical protein